MPLDFTNPMALAGLAVMSGKPLGDALIAATQTVQEQQYKQQQIDMERQKMAIMQMEQKRLQSKQAQDSAQEAQKLAMQQKFFGMLGGGQPDAPEAPAVDYSAPGGMSMPGGVPTSPTTASAPQAQQEPSGQQDWATMGLMGSMAGLEGANQFANNKITQQNQAQQNKFKNRDDVTVLRKEYVDASKDYVTMKDAYSKIQTSAVDPSGAGDVSLIFGYMRLLDPNSTVREGEYANPKNAGSIPSSIIGMYNKAVDGKFLSDTQRNDFVKRAGMVYNTALTSHGQVASRYKKLAESQGLPADQVAVDLGEAIAPKGVTPIKIQSDADWGKIPSGATYIAPDGSTRRKK
jgi:hypothetical protein